MATARKLPSGNYRIRVYDYTDSNGKKHYKSFTAPTKKEAEQLAALSEEDNKTAVGSMAEVFEKYIITNEPVLSPSTIRSYKNIAKILNKDYPKFCALKVSKIKQDDIQLLINDLSAIKSPKTVRNYHALITASIGAVRPSMRITTKLPQRIKPVLHIPDDNEIKILLEAVKGTFMELPILLGACCTMRRSEICGASIDDLEGNTLHIHNVIVRDSNNNWILKHCPKNDASDRYIELPDFIADKIREQGYITKCNPGTITKEFENVLSRLNIPSFRFHDLRHYSASVMHAMGIPDVYIMAAGGWKTDNVMKTVYRHTLSDKQKEIDKIKNSYFEMYDTKDDISKE